MCVGAADAERRHARPTRPSRLRPGTRLGQQLHRTRRPVHLGRRLVHVQRLRHDAVPECEGGLDDTGDTGRGLSVSDVGLQGAEPQRPVVRAILAVGGQQGLGLDGVAEGRARAVRLHHVHVRRCQARVGQGGADDPLLRGAVRGAQAVGRTVLVHRGTADHRQDRVAVAERVGEALDGDDARALAPAGPVRRGRERLAPAVTGRSAGRGELGEDGGGHQNQDTAREGEVALAGAQRLDGEVQGDQGGRARGVHGHRGALQAQHVGHAAGQHAAGGAGERVTARALGRVHDQGAVLLRGPADEDAGAAALERAGVDAGPFQGFPGRLQQQPLLRVHRHGLTR